MVPVPSLFFIGENGTPLEIVAGTITVDDLTSKIDNVLIKAGKNNKHSSLNLIDAEQKAAAASSSSSGSNNVTEAAAFNINNIKINSNIDSISIESAGTSTSYNTKDVIEGSIKIEPSLNTENKNNNEAPKENTETKQELQNKELTTEVCKLSNT